MINTRYSVKLAIMLGMLFLANSCGKKVDIENINVKNIETNEDIVTDYFIFENEIQKTVTTADGALLNIRESPIDGKIITQVSSGTEINFQKRTLKEYTVNSLTDYWYYGSFETNDELIYGWLFGAYLIDSNKTSATSNPYSRLDLSENGFSIKDIVFKTENDKKAWEILSGFYFVEGPRTVIDVIDEENDTSWGKDYSFGLGTHKILYENGKWLHGGDGEASFFVIDSISENGKIFHMKSEYGYEEIWRINGYYLYIDSRPYYKYTGPDCYKHFIRYFVDQYNESIAEFNLSDKNENLCVNVANQILQELINGNYKSILNYIDKDSLLQLAIADYSGKAIFSYDEIKLDGEEIISAFNFIKSDLSTHDNILSIKPNVNQFIHIDVKRFKIQFPNNDIIVEYILGNYEEISFIFKIKDEIVVLTGIIDNAVFRM